MKYLILVMVFLGIALSSACMYMQGIESYHVYSDGEIPGDENDVDVVIYDNGLSINNLVNINNMSPGRTVGVIYRIINESSGNVTPYFYFEIWRDPAAYRPEYERCPAELKEWIDIPEPIELAPGQVVDYLITLSIPDYAVIETDKWKFALGVAPGTSEFIQCGVVGWWLIDMR